MWYVYTEDASRPIHTNSDILLQTLKPEMLFPVCIGECLLIRNSHRVPKAQGKPGKWTKKIHVRENTGNLEILPKHRENTGNFVCSSCKFPDAKGKGYCDICRENFHFFFRNWIGLPSQFCVCKSYKLWKLAQRKIVVGQGKHREFENTI